MDIFAISLAVVSGLCLGTGLLYLFIGLRRRGTDMKHLTFALFALAYAGAVLFGLLMYRSTSLGQYLVVDRWSGVFAGLTYIFLVWFVAIYTGEQPLPFLATLTLLFATVIVAHVTRPTLIHGQIIGLASATLPWGEQITFLEAAESAWDLVFLVTQLLTIGFLFFACLRQVRRGERGAALALGTGLLLFVCTLVVDMLVESGALDFVLASDFGFLSLAIVMSLQMSNAVIWTEEELAHYRRRLELLVDERTIELKGANEQLAQANEELAALNSIAQTLSTVTDLPEALERVSISHVSGFADWRRRHPTDSGRIWAWVRAHRNHTAARVAEGDTLRPSSAAAGRIAFALGRSVATAGCLGERVFDYAEHFQHGARAVGRARRRHGIPICGVGSSGPHLHPT
jgi:hypothetical protein